MSALRNKIRLSGDWSRPFVSLGYVLSVSAVRIIALHGSVDNTLINIDQFAVPLVFAAAWRLRLGKAAIFVATFTTAMIVTALDVLSISQRAFRWDTSSAIDYLRATYEFPWFTITEFLIVLLPALAVVVGVMNTVSRDRPYVWPILVALPVLGILDIAVGVNRFMDIGHRYNIAISPGYTAATALAGRFVAEPAKLVAVHAKTLSGSAIVGDTPARMLSISYESWGLARDRTLRMRILQPLLSRLSSDYRIVEAGSHAFQGATLAGEVRELCGLQIVGVPKAEDVFGRFGSCLPARLAHAGYATDALHGNGGKIYSRETLYPAMGFKRRFFYSELKRLGASKTPCTQNVFFGICDKAVFDRALSLFDERPRFVHVMTLDTHLPILPRPDSAVMVRTGDTLLDAYLDAFRLSMSQLGDAIECAAVKPDRIILYGDHTPPFFSSKERVRFVPGRVPYLVLDRRN